MYVIPPAIVYLKRKSAESFINKNNYFALTLVFLKHINFRDNSLKIK